MPDNSSNNNRIAKNALMLYFRMFIMMAIGLYTSRVVLNTLGVEDYGIYSVVGGVISMFAFLTGAMSASSQRYITFALGRGDEKELSNIFCTSNNIHAILSLIIVVLGETVGLWLLTNKMVIPADRVTAAMWVYQISIATAVVNIMSTPYNALIIAHEKMNAFAYISIIEAILKLAIVYLLLLDTFNRLILYTVLYFVVQVIIRFVYSNYSLRHFPESKLRLYFNKKQICEMLSFAGWNMWGGLASVLFTQGVNILLNMFFGPVVNAARGIAVTVQSAVVQFTTNFQSALNPQLTKSYAQGDMAYMHSLIYRSTKFTFYLLLLLCLPILIETDTILVIWLKTVPDNTVIFVQLMLCISVIDAISNPLMVSAAATGRVKLYQSIVGGILLLIVPFSYIALKLGAPAYGVFIVHICVAMLAFVARIFILRPMVSLSLKAYFSKALLPCLYVVCIASIPAIAARYYIQAESLTVSLTIIVICVLSSCASIAIFGLEKTERAFLINKVNQMLKR